MTTNPRCGHCGGRTERRGLSGQGILFTCLTKGCRCTVTCNSSRTSTDGDCLMRYRTGSCNHLSITNQ